MSAVIGAGLIDARWTMRCAVCALRSAIPIARGPWFEPGLVIWLQRVGRQRLADHRLDGLLGVTNFGISMAASLAGVALAELLVAACAHAHGSALSVSARRCCGEQGCAAAALACSA